MEQLKPHRLSLVVPLRKQIESAGAVYNEGHRHHRQGVMLPYALERKFLAASTQWGWFWPIADSRATLKLSS